MGFLQILALWLVGVACCAVVYGGLRLVLRWYDRNPAPPDNETKSPPRDGARKGE